jgi:hypothetical protein
MFTDVSEERAAFFFRVGGSYRIYKTIILPLVLYRCETWSLTLREEHSLRVFENRVLRRIFGPRMDEVTGDWRKLHNEGPVEGSCEHVDEPTGSLKLLGIS